MTQEELTRLSLGQNLDDLANLDPRGYGVCRILYEAARSRAGSPLAMGGALRLKDLLSEPGSTVFLITGFVLPPDGKAETDGLIGSLFLARSLSMGLGAVPLVVCPEEAVLAVRALARALGQESLVVRAFTKDPDKADAEARALMAEVPPAAVVAVEAPGANSRGVYHNALGADVSAMEAKSDVLFRLLAEAGVPSFAVGDLGNEMGMGALGSRLARYIPRAAEGGCSCGCGGGIAAATAADFAVTATVSDWACYALCAALAYLQGNIDIMHTGELEREAILIASRNGLVDMNGLPAPAIDGCGLDMNTAIVTLMRELVLSTLRLKDAAGPWFDKVRELGFYEERNP